MMEGKRERWKKKPSELSFPEVSLPKEGPLVFLALTLCLANTREKTARHTSGKKKVSLPKSQGEKNSSEASPITVKFI